MRAAPTCSRPSAATPSSPSDPFTVAWLTGFAADETWGPNPFAAPPLAVVRGRRRPSSRS